MKHSTLLICLLSCLFLGAARSLSAATPPSDVDRIDSVVFRAKLAAAEASAGLDAAKNESSDAVATFIYTQNGHSKDVTDESNGFVNVAGSFGWEIKSISYQEVLDHVVIYFQKRVFPIK